MSAIAPGAFPSEMNRAPRDIDDSVSSDRVGQPENIAIAAIYLASRAGDGVVSEVLTVDGVVVHVCPSEMVGP